MFVPEPWVMRRLRDPDGGCPWDLQQDFHTIAPSTIEEAYEVVDAIEHQDFDHLREELGDLLFQVVFYAQLGAEQGRFNFEDVASAITEKLLRRHPHVFPDGTLNSAGQQKHSEEFVVKQWELIKQEERKQKGKSGLLADIPAGLPELVRAHKIQKRAASVGFDWPDAEGVLSKLDEEMSELKQALAMKDTDAVQDEIGDCLFTLVNLCRHLGVDAGSALRGSNRKFGERFSRMETAAEGQDLALKDCSQEQLDALWRAAKELD